MKQDYLHITYGGNVLVPDIEPNFGPMFRPQPLYKAVGGTAILHGVENRLI